MADRAGRILRRLAIGTAASVAAGIVVLGAPAGATEPSADLSVTTSHAPNVATTGEDLTLTATVRNDGPDVAEDVVLGFGLDYPLSTMDLPDGCTTSNWNNSVICELGDVAASAELVVDLAIRPVASGLYSVPIAVGSPTADPDDTDLVSTQSFLVKRGLPQAERYIRGIYPVILDREADPASIAYWVPKWQAAWSSYYSRNLATIPAGIIGSNEYRRGRIDGLYQDILGRPADPASLAAWVAKSKAKWTYQQIAAQLLASNEFKNLHPSDRVAAAFEIVFGRAPSSEELQSWTGTDTKLGAFAAARNMQRTTEAWDVVIKEMYQRTLGHDPDAFGRYIMQVRLRNGWTPERLWAELLVSNEVLEKYPFYEEEYPEPVYDFGDSLPALQAAVGS